MGQVTNADIYNKLIDIEGRLSTVETFAPVVTELQKIVIAGNGTPPMKERVNKIEDYIKVRKDVEKEKKEGINKIQLILITAVIGNVIATAFSFFK
jgi:hypothetical protein